MGGKIPAIARPRCHSAVAMANIEAFNVEVFHGVDERKDRCKNLCQR
jgi:hypothetical protein